MNTGKILVDPKDLDIVVSMKMLASCERKPHVKRECKRSNKPDVVKKFAKHTGVSISAMWYILNYVEKHSWCGFGEFDLFVGFLDALA